jgi:hypothetical protein
MGSVTDLNGGGVSAVDYAAVNANGGGGMGAPGTLRVHILRANVADPDVKVRCAVLAWLLCIESPAQPYVIVQQDGRTVEKTHHLSSGTPKKGEGSTMTSASFPSTLSACLTSSSQSRRARIRAC